ncbi:MAG: zinc ribbon domain-containing protein [Thermodesulfobacteriota bacterium]|nr:zinc ribbon domain-containing protein [Thermodesulfobacteriota bacterium]
MPIYEFKCLKCEEFFEILVMNTDEEKEIKCPKCSEFDIERVVSRTNYAMASPSSGANNSPSKQTRNCSSGSCTTYTIPGETKG